MATCSAATGGTDPPDRRQVIGWIAAGAVSWLVPEIVRATSARRSLPLDFVSRPVDLAITVLRMPPVGRAAALVPDRFSTRLVGTIGGGTADLRVPLPGILPTYRISGRLSRDWAELRVDRGILTNRLVELRRTATGCDLAIHRTDRQWRARRRTNHGTAVVGPTGVDVTITPDTPRVVHATEIEVRLALPEITAHIRTRLTDGREIETATLTGSIAPPGADAS